MYKKGNIGLNIYFIATFGFILALLGQTLLCGVLIGFAALAEKDNWLTRQTIQAFALCVFSSFVSRMLDIINIFSGIPLLGALINTIFGLITGLVALAVLVITIMSILKVCKGNEANVPFASKFANWAVGIIETKTSVELNDNQA